MRTDVLRTAAERNMFLSADALEPIPSNPEPMAFMSNVLAAVAKNTLVIRRDDVLGLLSDDLTITETEPVVIRNKRQSDISVIAGTDITGQSMCEGTVSDFTSYFVSRYNSVRDIIRRNMGAVLSIKDAKEMDREVRIIGMVSGTSVSKNGHRTLRLEDDSGSCKALILKDSPFAEEIFVNDEVVGIVGSPMGDNRTTYSSRKDVTIMVREVFRPSIPMETWNVSDSVSSVAFLSDIHVGSHTFLEEQWGRMTKWLRENARRTDLDYIILPGDVVDGIGIFAGQQKELLIDDIHKQYKRLAECLKEIPDHIRIVLQPGNHDAVRLAEPQPALSKAFSDYFDSNVMFTASPVGLNIEGRTVLTYHGRSIDDWVAGVQQLTYTDPVRIMEEMLERRHLAPMYGVKTALAPEKRDYLVIDKRPDIFVTGHVHGANSREYKGIRLIAASTWQSQTEFQRMHNFNPEPAVMPIVHLGTGNTTMKQF